MKSTDTKITFIAVNSILFNIVGSILIGQQYGWKTGVGVFLIAYAIMPVFYK